MFYSDVDVVEVIDLIITSSFLIAFLLSMKNWREHPSVFIVSAIFVINYVIAANIFQVLVDTGGTMDVNYYYLRWIKYDSLTVIAIIITHLVLRVKHSHAASLAMYLLMVNVFLYLAMHIDIAKQGNKEPWWLWDLYTPLINTVALSISSILIVSSLLYIRKKRMNARKMLKELYMKDNS